MKMSMGAPSSSLKLCAHRSVVMWEEANRQETICPPPWVRQQWVKTMLPKIKIRQVYRLVERWRDEAVKGGKMIERIALAFEAGRDGFWLARWLQARGIKCTSSIQPASRCRASIAGRRLTGWARRC
jgi:hypothetical protein